MLLGYIATGLFYHKAFIIWHLRYLYHQNKAFFSHCFHSDCWYIIRHLTLS